MVQYGSCGSLTLVHLLHWHSLTTLILKSSPPIHQRDIDGSQAEVDHDTGPSHGYHDAGGSLDHHGHRLETPRRDDRTPGCATVRTLNPGFMLRQLKIHSRTRGDVAASERPWQDHLAGLSCWSDWRSKNSSKRSHWQQIYVELLSQTRQVTIDVENPWPTCTSTPISMANDETICFRLSTFCRSSRNIRDGTPTMSIKLFIGSLIHPDF